MTLVECVIKIYKYNFKSVSFILYKLQSFNLENEKKKKK